MKQTNGGEAVKGYGKLVCRYMLWLGQRAGQEPAASSGCRDNQQHLGLHQQEHCRELRAGVVPSAQHLLLDHIWVPWPVWCPPMQKDTDNLE